MYNDLYVYNILEGKLSMEHVLVRGIQNQSPDKLKCGVNVATIMLHRCFILKHR